MGHFDWDWCWKKLHQPAAMVILQTSDDSATAKLHELTGFPPPCSLARTLFARAVHSDAPCAGSPCSLAYNRHVFFFGSEAMRCETSKSAQCESIDEKVAGPRAHAKFVALRTGPICACGDGALRSLRSLPRSCVQASRYTGSTCPAPLAAAVAFCEQCAH